MRRLVIPPAAKKDKRAVEMMRVWIAHQKLLCSLNVGEWKDSEFDERRSWGVMLADITRHVADALMKSEGHDPDRSIELIQKFYLEELKRPTSKVNGDYLK
ncbi:MAG TPA: DUF5076 domain-containing protein [Planctomycetota bacterium]|nr:DUF5076 domain-containing protein [Planctomycetota bacterium]